ncbi:hypothetical protein FOA52_011074 [Chlamydomonas sp. UWO 241]|nr:hypothetical protein FOA52_011074 [Chlamydomonas sp. UWO 241]
MGKKLKRGKTGNVAQYLTRTQAVRKLQLRLGEFRRLCILKGVHPREPKKKAHGANKTYYHIKDINFLQHEPLLVTFRDLKTYDKKIKKATAKQNLELAQRLKNLKPGYKVDHLVKERYPSFVDAVRDLDDPLTMVHLFATLPAEKRYDIPSKAVVMARRLSMEFNAYVVRTHALRRVFVSIKGFYYQAEILGQTVTWLVPHQLAQVLPTDVDYRVMLTFLEFYNTLLQFVNFKLYHMLELRYPPSLDKKMEAAADELVSIMADIAGVRAATNVTFTQQGQALAALEASEAAKRAAAGLPPLTRADGKEGEESEEGGEQEEVNSEDDGEDEGDEPIMDIDLGGDDSDDGDDEEDEESDGADAGGDGAGGVLAMMDAMRRDGGRAASTSTGGDDADVDFDADANMDGDGDGDGVSVAGGALGVDADDEASVCGSLFKGLTFFLAREVPREPLLLVIRAFGGAVSWDGEGAPLAENSPSITHQVVDRPTQGHRFLTRAYVQPQWVLDCANFRVLLPAALYAPGKRPPPHLSPFVDNDEEGYTPDFALTVKKLQDAARQARLRACGDAGAAADAAFAADAAEAAKPADAEDDATVEKVYHAELAKELRAAASGRDVGDAGEDESEDDEGEEESEEEAEEAPRERGNPKRAPGDVHTDETEQMKDIMMTRKNRKLYERIKRAQAGKAERIGVLEGRKRALEEEGGKEKEEEVQATPVKAGKASAPATPGTRRSTRLRTN